MARLGRCNLALEELRKAKASPSSCLCPLVSLSPTPLVIGGLSDGILKADAL